MVALAGLIAHIYVPIPRRQATDPIGEQLRAPKNPSLLGRKNAATGLARMADKDAAGIVPALIQAVGNQDPDVRVSAVGGLHVFPPGDLVEEEAALGHIGTRRCPSKNGD
jgi:hypothetical protein